MNDDSDEVYLEWRDMQRKRDPEHTRIRAIRVTDNNVEQLSDIFDTDHFACGLSFYIDIRTGREVWGLYFPEYQRSAWLGDYVFMRKSPRGSMFPYVMDSLSFHEEYEAVRT